MITIPPDIHTALGELTDKQAGIIERLLVTIGEDRARALIREAQIRLESSNQSDLTAPKNLRGALTGLIQTTLPIHERNPILGVPCRPTFFPPS